MVKRKRAGQSILLGMVILLLGVLSTQILWFFVLAPRLTIKKILLESDLGISDNQLLDMLDINGATWASLEELELQQRLESYPVVRKVRVDKVFPDTLKLHIYRRKPLAAALMELEGKLVPAVFDEEGYLVQVGPGSASLNLPILTGLQFSSPRLGARLPVLMRSVLSSLTVLRVEEPQLFSLISEVAILPNGNDGYSLKLYLSHIPIPILVDRNITVESMQRAILVLDVLTLEGSDVSEADIRGGNVVFQRSGES